MHGSCSQAVLHVFFRGPRPRIFHVEDPPRQRIPTTSTECYSLLSSGFGARLLRHTMHSARGGSNLSGGRKRRAFSRAGETWVTGRECCSRRVLRPSTPSAKARCSRSDSMLWRWSVRQARGSVRADQSPLVPMHHQASAVLCACRSGASRAALLLPIPLPGRPGSIGPLFWGTQPKFRDHRGTRVGSGAAEQV